MKTFDQLTDLQKAQIENNIVIPVYDLGIAIEFRNGQRQYYGFKSNEDMNEIKNRIIKTNEYYSKQLAIFAKNKSLKVTKKDYRPNSKIERICFYFSGQRINSVVEFRNLPTIFLTEACADTLKESLDLMCESVNEFVDKKETLAIELQIQELMAELPEITNN